jgi:hypothetical protein
MKEETTKSRSIQFRWRTRVFRAAPSVVAVAVMVLFVGGATASPVPTSSATALKAPYSGYAVGELTASDGGCGRSLSIPVLPAFNLTTGIANESAATSAHSCGTADSYISVELLAGLESATFTGKGGLQHLKATWVLTLTAKVKDAPGPSPQFVTAGFVVSGLLYIIDLTNGTEWTSSSPSVSYIFTGAGSLSHTYSKVHVTAYLNATLKASHTYSYAVLVATSVGVNLTPGTCAGSASVNMGSGGKSASLATLSFT